MVAKSDDPPMRCAICLNEIPEGNKGFTAPIVQALGAWKSEKMMKRYAAITDETLRAAAEAVAGNERWQYAAKPAELQAR